VRKSERKFIVFTSLVGVLTLTCALLLALAPAPLVDDGSRPLFAIDSTSSLDDIWATDKPVRAEQWKYIYIHHTKTTGGSAATLGQRTGGLGDHFLIGNGSGTFRDGEVQCSRRWINQLPALPPTGAAEIDPACISISVVGDFDAGLPTADQMRNLTRLVTLLQDRLKIPADQVLLARDSKTAAGSGQFFPIAAFRLSLLP
jgi:hypothetical protein